jgi:uncharacterized membrane protein (UPF0136 family)
MASGIFFLRLAKIVFFFVPATAIAGQAILGSIENGIMGDWRYRCVAIVSAVFIILIWMPGKTYRYLAAGRPGMPKTIVHAFTLVASVVGVFFAASESRPYAPMLIGPMAGAIVALKLYWLDDEKNWGEQLALMASIAIVGFGMQFFL